MGVKRVEMGLVGVGETVEGVMLGQEVEVGLVGMDWVGLGWSMCAWVSRK